MTPDADLPERPDRPVEGVGRGPLAILEPDGMQPSCRRCLPEARPGWTACATCGIAQRPGKAFCEFCGSRWRTAEPA